MAADRLFGLDLTFKSIETDLRKESDVILAFIHWNLIKRGFRSIGIGDERTLSGDEEQSELLPTGWNDNENYTIRYVLDSKLYILHGLTTDGNLIVNLMRAEDLSVSNITIKVEDVVVKMRGSVAEMIPSYKDLMYLIKRDLIDTLTEKATVPAETQTSFAVPVMPDPLIGLQQTPGWQPSGFLAGINQPDPLRNIGRSDLDPLGGPGQGMLFDPFRPGVGLAHPGLGIPGGLPRGAVPPGARFDPFGPPAGPMPGRRPPPPDADHLPPPGFNDNMFL